MKITKKEQFYCEFINLWSNMFAFMKILKDQEELYIYDIMVLSSLYILTKKKMRTLNQQELYHSVKIQSYRFRVILQRLIELGYVQNSRTSTGRTRGVKAAHKLSVTIKGVQFLEKYSKEMNKLCID